MQTNPVKSRLAAGEKAFGALIFEFFTPGIAQICKSAGADFVMYDLEHSAAGIETIKQQFAYCRGVGLVPLVRVPTGDYHFIARMLDAGALGIMVPMVETAEQAAAIVACTRYPPAGRRGAAFNVAHDDYEPGPVADKIARANERTMVICMIETPRGVENVDAIAATQGVDCCWVGHFDLTNFMGIPGQFDNPRYLEALSRTLAACRKHAKAAGFMAADETWARDYLARGFTMMAFGVDIHLLQRALGDGIAAMRSAGQSKARRPA